MKTVYVRIEDKTMEEIDKIVNTTGSTRQLVFNNALKDYVEKDKAIAEMAKGD